MRRSHEDRAGQVVELQVVDIGAAAGDEPRVLAAFGRIANDGLGAHDPLFFRNQPAGVMRLYRLASLPGCSASAEA